MNKDRSSPSPYSPNGRESEFPNREILPFLESGIRESFASGIRYPGFWNPEYSSRNPESH